ncbi:hypothetical protein L228DRAFT_61933 [Xylona heveae TC161]|uniref:Uncharacterized protein n=1 Tax=Xylona heveae (strain CBS 132557 / TC161) TaxID=1328760 RepID=A0A165IM41_XYLHT|nr:hypothetical protein L228DRAFT_61933 [Xylona heveae TC161]KZF25093.1 hypothetical protein L228DRAFT_61933 [Xylona heveae TC161]
MHLASRRTSTCGYSWFPEVIGVQIQDEFYRGKIAQNSGTRKRELGSLARLLKSLFLALLPFLSFLPSGRQRFATTNDSETMMSYYRRTFGPQWGPCAADRYVAHVLVVRHSKCAPWMENHICGQ